MSPGWALLLGAGGAFGVEFLLHIFPTRFAADLPPFVTRRYYWAVVVVAALIGGLVAFASASDSDISWYVAINIGATWPLIFQQGLRRTEEPIASSDLNP